MLGFDRAICHAPADANRDASCQLARSKYSFLRITIAIEYPLKQLPCQIQASFKSLYLKHSGAENSAALVHDLAGVLPIQH